MLVEYLERFEMNNILSVEDILDGNSAKLTFLVEELYKYQLQSDEEYVDFINNRIAKIGGEEIASLDDLRFADLINVLYQIYPEETTDIFNQDEAT